MRTKLSAAAALLILLMIAVTQGWVKPASSESNAVGLIVLADQGSFHVGGQPGQGDYAFVQYQIPPDARDLALVMWPEDGSSQLWDTTPDGRDGFRNIFVRRGFTTYVFDEPWHMRAIPNSAAGTPPPRANAQLAEVATGTDRRVFERFRIGAWPNYFPGVQFSRNAAALEQWWRQQTSIAASPGTGPAAADADAATYAAASLLAKSGPAVLLTHSASSSLGWLTRIRTPNVRALVSYEPASFVFPEGELPPPAETGSSMAVEVPAADFAKLTTIPIQLVYGDNIPTSPSKSPGLDVFRERFALARKMVDTINARGGRAELLHLPSVGIVGNTHIPMSDLNNVEIADLLSRWLSEKRLDRRGESS